MILEVLVVPNSKRFSISVKDGRIKVHLRNPPENNRANIELVNELSKLFRRSVRLVSGHTSKRKKLEVDIGQEELDTVLRKQ